jgi:hypothetical protein
MKVPRFPHEIATPPDEMELASRVVIDDSSSSLGAISEEENDEYDEERTKKTEISGLSKIQGKSVVKHEEEVPSVAYAKDLTFGIGAANDSDKVIQSDCTKNGKIEGAVEGLVSSNFADNDNKSAKEGKEYRLDSHASVRLEASDDDLLSTEPVPQANAVLDTPFAVSNQQLGLEEQGEARELATTVDGPNINLIPATPAPSSLGTTEPFDSPNDPKITAKSTAIEDDSGLVRARKQGQTNVDRPLTPSSMRSAGKEARDKNFLHAFWRVVFVDWIGGLIARLCGGGRRRNA